MNSDNEFWIDRMKEDILREDVSIDFLLQQWCLERGEEALDLQIKITLNNIENFRAH